MEINTEDVGCKCMPATITVTPRMIMNYAAGVGDLNPWHLDDSRPEGIIAPPMLVVALTWRLSSDFPRGWPGLKSNPEAAARQVHYTEMIEWFRPMLPGEDLRIEGEVNAILPHRAGAHMILEYRATDRSGNLVFVERTGAMIRGISCSGARRCTDPFPPDPAEIRENNGPLWEKIIHIGPLAAHIYDGCADIHFPIHSSIAFARMVGLPGPIYQGTATLAHALREIIQQEADNDPRRARALRCRFTGMVLLNTNITVQVLARIKRGDVQDVHFKVLNADGKAAVRNGCATIAI